MIPDKTKESLKYLWDGRDSATIMLMPDGWGIEGDYKLLGIAGELYGKKFQFNNSKGGNQLDVWYNQQQVATFKVENGLPKDGILYKADAPEEVLKVFAMFCALPYSYYN
jgi:hypothetical protein